MIQNMLAFPQQTQGNLGKLGSLASATQPSNSSGAMGGIMDSVQTGFDQLDSAMQGAFDTIKQSLSSSYTLQEVLVPNEGGGGQQPSFPGGGGGFPIMQPQPFRPGGEFIGDPMGETTQVLPDNLGINALPSPDRDFDISSLLGGEGGNMLRLPEGFGPQAAITLLGEGEQTNFGPPQGGGFGRQPLRPAGPYQGFGPRPAITLNQGPETYLQSAVQGTPTGGIGNAQMGVTNLNQDNNIGGASAQQQIDQMISGNAGQYNG